MQAIAQGGQVDTEYRGDGRRRSMVRERTKAEQQGQGGVGEAVGLQKLPWLVQMNAIMNWGVH